jgi:molecular chaperone GrpE
MIARDPTEAARRVFRMNESTMNNGESASAPDEELPQDAFEALRREAEENWNKYVRLAAEYENFRKRSARDVENARKFGAERLAQAILPVRDSLEAGLSASDKSDAAVLVQGQQATLRLIDEALTSVGVTEIAPKGEVFDPNQHEALSLLPASHVQANTVLEVIQKGYRMNDRLLRAAKVIVSRSESGD